ncbi:hypothetical protein ASF30_18240 [Leifsonia sp. Leaf264]|nr:hypothetical protein ASF30_18240 [Leifsonia sp. Leaf264]
MEHEEVLLMPRWLDAKRVTFKYGLGAEFITVLKTLHLLGLDSTTPVRVRSKNGPVEVAARDVVAASLPDPAGIGPLMTGKTCAGVWVTGTGTDGNPREVYLYHVADNECRRLGGEARARQRGLAFPALRSRVRRRRLGAHEPRAPRRRPRRAHGRRLDPVPIRPGSDR